MFFDQIDRSVGTVGGSIVLLESPCLPGEQFGGRRLIGRSSSSLQFSEKRLQNLLPVKNFFVNHTMWFPRKQNDLRAL